MVKPFLILILLSITGCTITCNTTIERPFKVSVPYYLHFKNNSPTEKAIIKIIDITNDRIEKIIYQAISEQIEERQNRGIFQMSGKYYVIISFPERKPLTEFSNDFIVEGNEKQIEIGLYIHSAP